MSLNRRSLLFGGAALSFAGLATACAPASKNSSGASDQGGESAADVTGEVEGTLRIHAGGDTNVRDLWQDGLGPAFTKKYPKVTIKVDHDLHSERSQQSLARLSAAGDGDSGMDFIDDGWVTDAADAKLLLNVSAKEIPALGDVPQEALAQGLGQAFPYRASSVLLAYDTEQVATPPKTLTELLTWIEQNPGKFAYNSPSTGGSGSAFVTSVLDLYIPKDVRERMTTSYDEADEKHWDKGWEELKRIGKFTYGQGTYPNGNEQSIELLVNGEVAMIPVWSDQFISGRESGKIPERVKATQISNPSFVGGASFLGIPKNSKNKPAALALAKFALSPEGQQIISTTMAGYPIIPLEDMPEEIQKKFDGIDTQNLGQGYFGDHEDNKAKLWDQKVPTA